MENVVGPVGGIILVAIVLYFSLRGGKKPDRNHPTRKRLEARRDNVRNIPPDTF